MQFTSEQHLDDGVLEREFTLGEIPGTLWTPGSAPAPLVLMAHNNGLPKADSRLVARARYTAARGYAVATIDAAGCGDRPRSAADEQARADFRRAMQAGEPVDEFLESFIGPLVENAVPEWRTTLDALLELPEIGGPVGYSGGGPRSVSGWRWSSRASRPRVSSPGVRAPCPARGGPAGHRSAAVPAAVGRRREPPAAGPGAVRRLRQQGEDVARQSGRAHRHPVVRAGGRVPVLRPTPEVRPVRSVSRGR